MNSNTGYRLCNHFRNFIECVLGRWVCLRKYHVKLVLLMIEMLEMHLENFTLARDGVILWK